MAYQIEEYPDRLEIAIDAPPAERDSFLDLLDACTQGERACPALRCGTVETRIPVTPGEAIRIKVVPHPDVRIDRKLIERCLAFTLGGGKRCCAGTSA
ncbi:MAG TPA: hypothetical protein VLD36_16840 [Burkholderiales bacterium]|jgi:hypothetical protein|nr:hypothetical protein [Burkholderiales bacterium]